MDSTKQTIYKLIGKVPITTGDEIFKWDRDLQKAVVITKTKK